MKIAFCLFKYFPYGGLQRDFLKMANLCVQRGHDVIVYTMKWDGEAATGFNLQILPVKGAQNHTRKQAFVDQVTLRLQHDRPDVVMGFNKMPNLDIYYAADVCYQSRAREKHGAFYRMLPRYRRLVELEEAVFA